MAKLQYGTIVTQISGSIGGNVFSRGSNGNYIRRKSRNVNTRSIGQLARRNAFASVTSGYRNLTTTQVATWKAAAPSFPYTNSLGVISYYTGYQLHSKINNQLLAIFYPPLVTAPTPVSFPLMESFIACYCGDPDIVYLYVDFDDLSTFTVPTGFTLVVQATANMSTGVSSPKDSLFRTITSFPAGTIVNGVNIYYQYFAIFGQIPSATNYPWCRVFLVSTVSGQKGTSLQMTISSIGC